MSDHVRLVPGQIRAAGLKVGVAVKPGKIVACFHVSFLVQDLLFSLEHAGASGGDE